MPVISIPVDNIKPDPKQPRKIFNEERLKNLSHSIAEVGILQPIIVRPTAENQEQYYLVAGERRWRGAKKAGEKEILATILEDDSMSIRQLQLVENLQREDLDPLEKARSIQQFMEEEGYNKSLVSKKLGIPRTTVTEWLNILEVAPHYQGEVVKNFEGETSPLTLSHISLAKALDQKTGDPSKKQEFLDAVLAHDLSREEARRVVQLFDRYYNITVEEAVAAIRLYSSSELLKKKKDRMGKKKEKEGLPENLEEIFSLLENLIQWVDELLGQDLEVEGAFPSLFLERMVLLHSLVGRLLKESMGIPAHKFKSEELDWNDP